MNELTRRAHRAYSRSADALSDQPEGGDAGPYELAGRWYIVLRNVRGVLAVFRVGTRGELRRLRRWPAALERT